MVHFWHFIIWLQSLHGQPVLQVMSKVISKERSHGKWIMHYDFTLELGRGSGLRLHGSTDEYTVLPIKSFVHKRNSTWTSATEQYGVNRYTFWGLPVGVNYRTLSGRCTKPANRYSCVMYINIWESKTLKSAELFRVLLFYVLLVFCVIA